MVCYGFSEQQEDSLDTLTSISDHNQRILRNILDSPYPVASNVSSRTSLGSMAF